MNPTWMNDPRIRDISPEKLAVMTLLMENAEGKSPEEFLPVLMQTSQSLEKAGMSFTANEKNVILDVLKEDMTPAEKQRLSFIQTLLNQS